MIPPIQPAARSTAAASAEPVGHRLDRHEGRRGTREGEDRDEDGALGRLRGLRPEAGVRRKPADRVAEEGDQGERQDELGPAARAAARGLDGGSAAGNEPLAAGTRLRYASPLPGVVAGRRGIAWPVHRAVPPIRPAPGSAPSAGRGWPRCVLPVARPAPRPQLASAPNAVPRSATPPVPPRARAWRRAQGRCRRPSPSDAW